MNISVHWATVKPNQVLKKEQCKDASNMDTLFTFLHQYLLNAINIQVECFFKMYIIYR